MLSAIGRRLPAMAKTFRPDLDQLLPRRLGVKKTRACLGSGRTAFPSIPEAGLTSKDRSIFALPGV